MRFCGLGRPGLAGSECLAGGKFVGVQRLGVFFFVGFQGLFQRFRRLACKGLVISKRLARLELVVVERLCSFGLMIFKSFGMSFCKFACIMLMGLKRRLVTL